MKKYSNKDINMMTWNEFDSHVQVLISKVEAFSKTNNITFNVVAPMLRTGGIVGSAIAIKMKIETMLPVQFKNRYDTKQIDQIISIPEILARPKVMNIFLAEGNTSSGATAVKSAKAIKNKYPESKIYLATLAKVFGGPEKLDGIEEVFYATMTDENFTATEDQIAQLNLRRGVTIFPWEIAEDELADLNAIPNE